MIKILSTTLLALSLCACGVNKQHQKIERAGKELRFELANLYVTKGAKEHAIPLLRRILAEEPKNLPARVLYATVLRDLGLYPQSEKQLKMVLDLNAESAEAHSALGILNDLRRLPREAVKHHSRAASLAPARADFQNNLGFSHYLGGEFEAAIVAYEKALALDPALSVAYNNLGFVLGRVGQFKRARRTFTTALGEAGADYNMALVFDRHGQHQRADALRQSAFTDNPELRVQFQKSSREKAGIQ